MNTHIQKTSPRTSASTTAPSDNCALSVTIRVAAKHLCSSPTTVYNLIKAGAIKSFRIGKRGLRIPMAEIERFIAEGGSDQE